MLGCFEYENLYLVENSLDLTFLFLDYDDDDDSKNRTRQMHALFVKISCTLLFIHVFISLTEVGISSTAFIFPP